MTAVDYSLYLVTDKDQCLAQGRSVTETVLQAVDGGVTFVQLRDKNSPKELFETVRELNRELPSNIPLIINDRVDVYQAAITSGYRVDGVHIGQSDLPATVVRRMLGSEAIIGVSAATPLEIAAAVSAGADYIGIGAVHETKTKADAPAALGIDGVAALAAASVIPSVAIGGITANDLPLLRAAGLNGAAVVSAICAAPDARAAASVLKTFWES